jgi:hypothetical protein
MTYCRGDFAVNNDILVYVAFSFYTMRGTSAYTTYVPETSNFIKATAAEVVQIVPRAISLPAAE